MIALQRCGEGWDGGKFPQQLVQGVMGFDDDLLLATEL